jgi:hypothetical protein
MKNQTTNLQLIIRNDELKKCKNGAEIQNYLDSVVLPLIFDSLSSASKDINGGMSIECSTRGDCTVRGDINF